MVLKVFGRSRMVLCRRLYGDSFGCRDADDVVNLRFFLFPLIDQFHVAIQIDSHPSRHLE